MIDRPIAINAFGVDERTEKPDREAPAGWDPNSRVELGVVGIGESARYYCARDMVVGFGSRDLGG